MDFRSVQFFETSIVDDLWTDKVTLSVIITHLQYSRLYENISFKSVEQHGLVNADVMQKKAHLDEEHKTHSGFQFEEAGSKEMKAFVSWRHEAVFSCEAISRGATLQSKTSLRNFITRKEETHSSWKTAHL